MCSKGFQSKGKHERKSFRIIFVTYSSKQQRKKVKSSVTCILIAKNYLKIQIKNMEQACMSTLELLLHKSFNCGKKTL